MSTPENACIWPDLANAIDIGPAPTPPAWCEPDTLPDWGTTSRERGALPVAAWCRSLGDVVYIGCEDFIVGARMLRTPPRIHVDDLDGINTTEARQVAAALLNAADLIDEAANR